MTTYVDTSALLKRYVDEADSERAVELLNADRQLVSARHMIVEVRRNLARLLSPVDLAAARSEFMRDLESISLVELDADTCELASVIGEETGARTLDALHLAAASRLGTSITFLTFDIRQATIARALGFIVAGV